MVDGLKLNPMNNKFSVVSTPKNDVGKTGRSITMRENRDSPYYLPIIFLIVLVTVIVIDVLNG